MLDNIKLILGLETDEHDNIILLYVSKVSASVVEYCNITDISPSLESFVEDKVVEIMKPKISGGNQNAGEVKAVTRGDTRIEYNVSNNGIADTGRGATLNDSDKKFLNTFRKLRMY